MASAPESAREPQQKVLHFKHSSSKNVAPSVSPKASEGSSGLVNIGERDMSRGEPPSALKSRLRPRDIYPTPLKNEWPARFDNSATFDPQALMRSRSASPFGARTPSARSALRHRNPQSDGEQADGDQSYSEPEPDHGSGSAPSTPGGPGATPLHIHIHLPERSGPTVAFRDAEDRPVFQYAPTPGAVHPSDLATPTSHGGPALNAQSQRMPLEISPVQQQQQSQQEQQQQVEQSSHQQQQQSTPPSAAAATTPVAAHAEPNRGAYEQTLALLERVMGSQSGQGAAVRSL